MDLLIDVLLPGVVFLLMGIVGTGLTTKDLRRVLVIPRAVLGGTLGQIILLPMLAVLFVRLTMPGELIAAGLLLLVACPGGALSNTYTYLARANLALSVTLTALSSILSVLYLPLVVRLTFEYGLGRDLAIEMPVTRIVAQLAFLLLLPIALGMTLRRMAPGIVARRQAFMQRISWSAIIAILAFVFYQERARLPDVGGAIVAHAAGFTVFAMLLGLAVARLSGLTTGRDRLAMVLEFSNRNLPVATLIGVTLLGRTDYVIFAATTFFAQALILPALVWWYRSRGQSG